MQIILPKSLGGLEAVEEWVSYEQQIMQIFGVLIEHLN